MSRIPITIRAGISILLVLLGIGMGWFARAKVNPAPQQNAGGSATGNALDVATGPKMFETRVTVSDTLMRISIAEPLSLSSLSPAGEQRNQAIHSNSPPVLSGLQQHSATSRLQTEVLDPDGDGLGLGSPLGPDPWEGRKDSISRALDSTELLSWLKARGIAYNRLILLSPEGDNSQAKPGLAGPAFQDLAAVRGGLFPGDLVVYRAGVYRYSVQLPAMGFRATPQSPLTLLAWPGERVTFTLANPFHLRKAANWHMVGFEWSTHRADTLGPVLEGTEGIHFEDCSFLSHAAIGISGTDEQDLSILGSLFSGPALPISILKSANLLLQGNVLNGTSILLGSAAGDSLHISNNLMLADSTAITVLSPKSPVYLRDNMVIGSGRGCLRIEDSHSALILVSGNSFWNRNACKPSEGKNLLLLDSLSANTEIQVRQNLFLDEVGSISSTPLPNLHYSGNRLFARGQTLPKWLTNGNLAADPGFSVLK
jgi:hypothetical protein